MPQDPVTLYLSAILSSVAIGIVTFVFTGNALISIPISLVSLVVLGAIVTKIVRARL